MHSPSLVRSLATPMVICVICGPGVGVCGCVWACGWVWVSGYWGGEGGRCTQPHQDPCRLRQVGRKCGSVGICAGRRNSGRQGLSSGENRKGECCSLNSPLQPATQVAAAQAAPSHVPHPKPPQVLPQKIRMHHARAAAPAPRTTHCLHDAACSSGGKE